VHCLYENTIERENQRFKFHAAIHGINLDDNEKQTIVPSESGIERDAPKKSHNLVFRDPAEYDKMSESERQELTQRMMGKWKRWAGESPLAKAKKG